MGVQQLRLSTTPVLTYSIYSVTFLDIFQFWSTFYVTQRKKHCHISRLSPRVTLTCPVEKRQRRNDAATPKTPTWESIGCRRDGCASFLRKIYNYNPLLVGTHTLVHFEGLVSVLLGKSFFSPFSGLEIASFGRNYVKNATGLPVGLKKSIASGIMSLGTCWL